MQRYATRYDARHLPWKVASICLILLTFIGSGCSTTRAPGPHAAPLETEEADRPAPSTIATYGALTSVGVGAAAVGGYFIAEAERSPDRTGSRPELWGGVQAVAGGAALAIPFGYLTASSLLARDDADGVDERGRSTSPALARDAERPAVTLRPRIGPGSLDVSGEF